MKAEVIKNLKENGRQDIFTENRYEVVKQVMAHGMKNDQWLKNYLSLDPLNKAEWISDHMIKLVDLNKI